MLLSDPVGTHYHIFVLPDFNVVLTAEKTLPPADGRVVLFAVRVVSKESGQIVFSRSFCLLLSFCFSVFILSLDLLIYHSFIKLKNINENPFNYPRVINIANTASASDDQMELSVLLR
jgi:hypothetical protein